MLAQLKNLFRQKTTGGTSNNKKNQHQQHHRRGPRYRHDNKVKVIDYTSNLQPMSSLKKKPTVSEEEQERIKTAERAQRLIEQEKQRKAQLPMYVGLERYEILKKLGDGAFSNVYKGRDMRTGRRVAIKVVRKPDAETENQNHLHPSMKQRPRATERANILKEVQIMRNIRHPNVVQLIQFTESKENYFLVMELCDGGELFHRIVKMTYFSEPLSRHVITQVAQGVRHLHEVCGVVHRDIKPENILFEAIPFIPTPPQQRVRHAFDHNKEDEGIFIKDVGGGGIGTVKLADFGLSKQIWDNSTFTPCGTVGYTAPEIVRDQRYSKSVDMWAIGCVLYTMLCGFPPFYDESIHALTEKVARGQYAFLSPWWDPISDAAKDLITRLLCVDPNERYTIDQFLAHPWVTEEPFVKPEPPSSELLQSNVNSNATPSTLAPTASTLSTDASSLGRRDVFSPGVPTLKEILDVTYAVQRMGEEKSFRQHGKSKATASTSKNIPGASSISPTSPSAAPSTTKSISKRNNNYNKNAPVPFELSMDNATLLKNRRAHQPAPVPQIC